MKICFICKEEIETKESLNLIECSCKNCGKYAYEKNFLTTFDYYLSVNSLARKEKIENFLKTYVLSRNICFVDDFETSIVEGYDLIELRDILNLVGLEVTHNNTIDSNWTD